MKNLILFGLISTAVIALSACSTLHLDKDRATETRKQELCRDISTRDLPQCTGALDREPQTS